MRSSRTPGPWPRTPPSWASGSRWRVWPRSAGLDSETLTPRLEILVRRELLAMETDPRSPERNQYGFVQSLIREVTYNTLARRDRKTRHLAAARFFESLETDELAGGLAGQYLAAHANADGPEETAALAAQARVALRAAADRALALGGTDAGLRLPPAGARAGPGSFRCCRARSPRG